MDLVNTSVMLDVVESVVGTQPTENSCVK